MEKCTRCMDCWCNGLSGCNSVSFLRRPRCGRSCDSKNTPRAILARMGGVLRVRPKEEGFGRTRQVILDCHRVTLARQQAGAQLMAIPRRAERNASVSWNHRNSLALIDSFRDQTGKSIPMQNCLVLGSIVRIFSALKRIACYGVRNAMFARASNSSSMLSADVFHESRFQTSRWSPTPKTMTSPERLALLASRSEMRTRPWLSAETDSADE